MMRRLRLFCCLCSSERLPESLGVNAGSRGEADRREHKKERPHGPLNQITPATHPADVVQEQKEAV